jgi:O-antigen ligase
METGTGQGAGVPSAARVARHAALAAIPLSLTSPGATVAMAVAALAGLWLWRREGALPAGMAAVGRACLALYALVLGADLLNGGGLANLATTGVNYLPVLAIVPVAVALRRSALTAAELGLAMRATILIAAVSSAVQFWGFGVPRPGGLNLNSIPFALMVLVWGLFQLAESRGRIWSVPGAFALLALVPIVLSGSKNVFLCTVVGFLAVAAVQYRATRDRRILAVSLGAVALGAAAVAVSPMADRVAYFVYAFGELLGGTMPDHESLGQRAIAYAGSLEMFAARPLLGYGFAEHVALLKAHIGAAGTKLETLGHLHSDYLTHMVAYGIAGLAFLAGILGLALRLAAGAATLALQGFGFGFAAVLAAYMVFEIAFNMDPVSGPVALVLGVMLAWRADA